MSIKDRLKKLETSGPNKTPCFCNKTLVDLWWRNSNTDALTYCRNCKDKFDFWANLSTEAKASNNLTDAIQE